MKLLSTIFFFSFFATVCFSQTQDFIVENSGDTIFGKVKYLSYSFRKGARYKIKTDSGEKYKFDTSSAKLIHYEDADHILMPVKPEKPKKSFDDFMSVMMSNGKSTVYRHKYKKIDGKGVTSVIIHYYLYDDGGFVDFLKKKNFDELIPKYFGDCERLVREMKNNRRFKFDDLFRTYNNFCK
jgi:hypothetical protein